MGYLTLPIIIKGEAPLTRLYSTSADGYNLRSVLNNVKGYRGPTVVVAKDKIGRVYGGYASIEWEDGCATRPGNFLKDDDCFLFHLSGPCQAYRSVGPQRNHIYLETEARARGLIRGFGMGGSTKEFRFFVPDDFRTVQWRSRDKTYEAGPLSDPVEAPLVTLEVWGCGGKSAEEAKKRARQYAAEAKKEELRRLGKAVLYGDGGEELRGAALSNHGAGQDARDRAGIDEIRPKGI